MHLRTTTQIPSLLGFSVHTSQSSRSSVYTIAAALTDVTAPVTSNGGANSLRRREAARVVAGKSALARRFEALSEGSFNDNSGKHNYRGTLCACIGPQLYSGHNGSRLRVEAGVGVSSDSREEAFVTMGVRKVTEHLWNLEKTPNVWPPRATPEAVQQVGWRMEAAAHMDYLPDFTKLNDTPEDKLEVRYLSRRASVRMDCGSWLTSATRRQEQFVLSAGVGVDWPMANGTTWWGAPHTSKPKTDPFVHIKSPIGLGVLLKKDSMQLTLQL